MQSYYLTRLARGGEDGEMRSFLVKPGDEAAFPPYSKLFNQHGG